MVELCSTYITRNFDKFLVYERSIAPLCTGGILQNSTMYQPTSPFKILLPSRHFYAEHLGHAVFHAHAENLVSFLYGEVVVRYDDELLPLRVFLD